MSGFLQLPLPRCAPSTALQVGDRSYRVEKSLMSNYSRIQVQVENISRSIFPSKFEILIVMDSLKVSEGIAEQFLPTVRSDLGYSLQWTENCTKHSKEAEIT